MHLINPHAHYQYTIDLLIAYLVLFPGNNGELETDASSETDATHWTDRFDNVYSFWG